MASPGRTANQRSCCGIILFWSISSHHAKMDLNKDFICLYCAHLRRGGRVVEGARLERVYMGNHIEGSNPSLSATPNKKILNVVVVWHAVLHFLTRGFAPSHIFLTLVLQVSNNKKPRQNRGFLKGSLNGFKASSKGVKLRPIRVITELYGYPNTWVRVKPRENLWWLILLLG